MTFQRWNNEDYLRSEDMLREGKYIPRTLKIEAVIEGCPLTRRLQKVDGFSLKFAGANKVLGLGLTNESLVKAITGDARPEKWVGHEVTIAVRRIRRTKDNPDGQPAIRIMPPKGMAIRSGLAKELGEAYE